MSKTHEFVHEFESAHVKCRVRTVAPESFDEDERIRQHTELFNCAALYITPGMIAKKLVDYSYVKSAQAGPCLVRNNRGNQ